jgi:sugar phosphate isomerase/epimerase
VPFSSTRRTFLGAAGVVGLSRLGAAPISDNSDDFKLGVATYSLRKFSRADAIRMIKDLNTPYVSVKEFHLRYKDSPEELEKGRKEFADAGLKIMSGGVISFHDDDEAPIRKYFDYARTCGMPLMIIMPTHANMGKVEQLAKEYNIRVAIHNHGPEDKNFPTPQSALEVVRKMDPRCGVCIDLGHTANTGTDVVKSIADAGDRLFDVHIKDMKSFSDIDSQCDVGEGAMPIPAIFKQLRNIDYRGCVNLEYEIHPENPLPGMQKSFSYMRGVRAGLHG